MPRELRVVEPLYATWNREEPEEEEMLNGLIAPACPTMDRVAPGEEELMPISPLPSMSKKEVPEEEATSNITPMPWSVVSTWKTLVPELFWTERAEAILTGGWTVKAPVAATLSITALVEEATLNTSSVGEVDVPWTDRVAVGVVEPMPTLWLLVTLRTETPEEDETLRMSLLPLEPWMLKVTVLDVALMPATVPLSWSRPVVRAEAEDQTASLPGTPVPVMVPPPLAVPMYSPPLASA